MSLSIEFWIGTAIAILCLALGLGATIAMDARTKGELNFAVCCFLGSAATICYGIGSWELTATLSAKYRRPLALILFALTAIGTVEAIRWAHRRHLNATGQAGKSTQQPARQAATEEKPPTLLDLFLKGDFSGELKITDSDADAYTIQWRDGQNTRIKRQTYLNFEAKTKFIGFYIFAPAPASADTSSQKTMAACTELLKFHAVEQTFGHFAHNVDTAGGFGDQMTWMRDLTFSGRVFIYHEEFLSIPQKAEILKTYDAKGLSVTFRGSDYLGTQVIAWHQQHDKKEG
jgi:hypothetical protein